MSSFTGHAALYPFQAADTGLWSWALAEPLEWEVRSASGTAGVIFVPAHFLTDLGSIPPWARWLINPADPQLAKAFVLHDWLLHIWGPGRQIEAAGVMHEALCALGVAKWRRILITLGVIAGVDRW